MNFDIAPIADILDKLGEEEIEYCVRPYSVELRCDFENGKVTVEYYCGNFKLVCDCSYVPANCTDIYIKKMARMIEISNQIKDRIEIKDEKYIDDPDEW